MKTTPWTFLFFDKFVSIIFSDFDDGCEGLDIMSSSSRRSSSRNQKEDEKIKNILFDSKVNPYEKVMNEYEQNKNSRFKIHFCRKKTQLSSIAKLFAVKTDPEERNQETIKMHSICGIQIQCVRNEKMNGIIPTILDALQSVWN